MSVRGVALGFSLCVMALGAGACAKVDAKTPGPPRIALSVPEPPTRTHIPVTVEPPPPPPAPEKPAAPSTPATKPKPVPAPSPTPTAPPPASATETAPPPVVQTSGQAEHEKTARERLGVAEAAIKRVRRDALGREAQSQYDNAMRFIRTTQQALAAKNFVYAAYCADKAATLAALLVKG